MVIEDSIVGLKAAKAAGMRYVLLFSSFFSLAFFSLFCSPLFTHSVFVSLSHCLSLPLSLSIYLSVSLSLSLSLSLYLSLTLFLSLSLCFPLTISLFLSLSSSHYLFAFLSLSSSHYLSLSFSPFLFRCIITYTDSTATEDFYA